MSETATPSTHPVKRFAGRFPFLFTLICFLLLFGLLVGSSLLGGSVLLSPTRVALQIIIPLLITLFSVGILAWFGWLRDAGFSGRSQWRNLRVLWAPALATLIVLAPAFSALRQVNNYGLVAYAVLVALLAGLNEEAFFRGLVLRALQPYGLVAASALSAIFFALAHANNLFLLPLYVALPQVVWAFFLGFAFAAFRLRTRAILPLMILHGLSDIYIDIMIFATPRRSGALTGSGLIAIILSFGLLIVLYGALAVYGFFLLRREAAEKKLASAPTEVTV